MGKYTMIADTGKRLVEMLQQALCPGLIRNTDEIGLRSPEDKGDVSLGVFLYDIRQSEEVFQQSNVVVQEQDLVTRISRPPVYLSLYYMITPYTKGDVMYRLYQEEQVLGRIIQLFYDNPVFFLEETEGAERLYIQMQKPDMDEKSKIWNFPNMGNRLSLFYKVSPVAIDSGISRKTARVTDVDINVSQHKM
ncbi:MAG: DUF4255 domain-containing protein [Lachnospiraceae bacterium]|nr:DUF4255 domain-containing protein [Lachnospiraceae bacterium]